MTYVIEVMADRLNFASKAMGVLRRRYVCVASPQIGEHATVTNEAFLFAAKMLAHLIFLNYSTSKR